MQLSFDENMTIDHIREAILPSDILPYLHITFKGTVSRGGYFLEVYIFYLVLSVYALVVFKVFQKLVTTMYNFI